MSGATREQIDRNRAAIIEALAELAHSQWMEWSQELNRKEQLSMGRQARWAKLWIEYAKLPEEIKELDRTWAKAYLARTEAVIANTKAGLTL